MNRPHFHIAGKTIITHCVIALVCIAAIYMFDSYNMLNVDLLEETLWLFFSTSLAIEWYKHIKSGYFLLSVIIYLSGMALDVLDEINFMRQFGVLQLDTSLKNIGFIFICIGLLRLIHDKRKIINTLSKTISNNQLLQEQLLFDANHDPLTQIGNRRALFSQYRQLSRTHNKLLYFDLDNFKQANDTHGHQMGYQVLKLFAKSMLDEFDHTSCFRIGGDEFLALTDRSYDEQQLRTLKNRLSQSIKKYNVGVSIGFYTNTHNETIDACLHKADRAMYHDKQST